MSKNYLTVEEAITELKLGKKIKNIDWGNKHYHHLEIIRTQEFKDDNISSQPFIALMYENAGFMPHPYAFTDLDIIGGESWVVV